MLCSKALFLYEDSKNEILSICQNVNIPDHFSHDVIPVCFWSISCSNPVLLMRVTSIVKLTWDSAMPRMQDLENYWTSAFPYLYLMESLGPNSAYLGRIDTPRSFSKGKFRTRFWLISTIPKYLQKRITFERGLDLFWGYYFLESQNRSFFRLH